MRKAIIAAMLALGCAGTDEVYLEGTVTAPEQAPMSDEDMLARLQAEAPEGVEVRLAEPGEVPAYTEISHSSEDTVTRHFNADGSPWIQPPRTVDKARWGCPGHGGNECPCYEPTGPGIPKDVDYWGNMLAGDGRCAFPDNGTVSWAAVQYRFSSAIGNFAEVIPAGKVGDHFGLAFNAQIDAHQWPSGYSFGWRNPQSGFPDRPAGWSSGQLEPVTAYPTNPLLYPRNTDVVFRRADIQRDGSFYQAPPPDPENPGLPTALTKLFYLRTAPAPWDGVFTNYGTPVVYRWRPTSGLWGQSDRIEYLVIAGAAITLDYAKIYANAVAASGPESAQWKRDMALRHTICHELGHAVGLGHSSATIDTCMTRYMPNQTVSWSTHWGGMSFGALANATQNAPSEFCGRRCNAGGTGLSTDGCGHCINGTRAPLGIEW